METLKQSLDSVLNLRGLDSVAYEILISDDSEDSKVSDYLETLHIDKIKYLRNLKHGQFNNLNNLYNNASGKWLVFLHDDDLLHQDYLEQLRSAMEAKEAPEIFYSTRSLIDTKGNIIKEKSFRETNYQTTVESGTKVFDSIFYGDNNFEFPMVTGLAIKKDLVDKVGGFDGRLYVNGDALFIFETVFLASGVMFANIPLVSYRVVEESERARPSRDGIVYEEMKRLFYYTLDFVEKHMEKSKFEEFRKNKEKSFYRKCTELNGPILWIALRYEANYCERVKKIFSIATDISRHYKATIRSKNCYIALLVGLFPRVILRKLYSLYLRAS